MTVTRDEYNALDGAFNYFNEELFDSKLPPCLITFQRRSRTRGYYSPDRFSNRNVEAQTDEIALNPSTFEARTDEEILSTLVHEMVHQYQSEHGTPGKWGYHNKEWAGMMMERGLMPSTTGEPGGKKTGRGLSHYIIEGSPFQLACRRLLNKGFKLNWQDGETYKTKTGKVKTGKVKDLSKVKFTCLKCGQNAWAKWRARLLCGVCYGKTGELIRMQDNDAKRGENIEDDQSKRVLVPLNHHTRRRGNAMRVISASRRTDVPAFYSQWFMNRIRAGFCHWLNPFGGQVYRASLAPNDCIAIVFWTRNPNPLIPHLAELDRRGYKYFFSYTILGYPRSFDTHAPALDAAIRIFQALSERITPDYVFWRYDPIVISNLTPLEFHTDRFAYIAQRLAGYTQRCIYAFVNPYRKTKRNLSKLSEEGIEVESPTSRLRDDLLTEMVRIAQSNGMRLYCCCEEDDLHIDGVQRSSCVDLEVLRQLTADPNLYLKPKPSKKLCGCVESVDIGSYDTCLHGCVYCYATNSRQAALLRHATHDPNDTVLFRPDRLRGIDLDTLIKK